MYEVTHYRWGFDLINVNSVEGLSWRMPGPDVAILREEEDAMPAQLFFSSQHLNDLDDVAHVVTRGNILKALFDGAYFLEIGLRHRPEPLREVWDLQNTGRYGKPDPTPGIKPFSTTKCAQPLTPTEATRVLNDFAEGAIYTSRTDATVFGMLLTLGRDGVDWRTLYALTDTMKTNGMSLERQWQAARSSKTEYELFKRTANSFAVLGPDARHGETRNQPPPKPIEFDRAADIVLAAANAFVNARKLKATATLGLPRKLMVKLPAPNSAVPSIASLSTEAARPYMCEEGEQPPQNLNSFAAAPASEKSKKFVIISAIAVASAVLVEMLRRRHPRSKKQQV